MSDGGNIAPYLAHFGIEVTEDELAHYGKKGMKWGVRNDDRGGSSKPAGKGWTDDQKQKARNVAIIAGVVGLGAAYVATRVYAQGADQRLLEGIRSSTGRLPAGQVRLGASLPSQKGTYKSMAGFLDGIVKDGKIQRAARDGVMSEAYRKSSAGKNFAEQVLKDKGGTKIVMDPELRKFVKDAPARILADQKGWSTALGKSLGKIQAEDASFMAEYIKNYAPKALGA